MNPLENAMQQYILDFHPVLHALEMASTPKRDKERISSRES